MAQTLLLTGATGALGRCFAKIHAAAGGDLVLVGRSIEKLNEEAKELRDAYGVSVDTIASDFSTPHSAKKVHDECVERRITVAALINNAGFGGQGDFVRERDLSEDLSMIQVNVTSLVELSKLFLEDFVRQGHGRVLNVASVASLTPGPLEAVYFASKAFVRSFSMALWEELRGTGVSVTALLPGAMKTPFITRGGLEGAKLFSVNTPPENVAKLGYRAMQKGQLTVTAGLLWWQKPLVALAPILPKKFALWYIHEGQKVPKKATKTSEKTSGEKKEK